MYSVLRNKSKPVGYLLAFLLGGLGVHAFYYRRYVRGIVYLILCWTYIPIILGWIDMLFINKWHKQLQESGSIVNSEPKTVKKLKPKLVSEVKKEKKLEQVVDKKTVDSKLSSLKKKHVLYEEDEIILTKYSHIQTPKEILESIEEIKNPKKRTNSVGGISIEVNFSHSNTDFVKDSIRYSKVREKESPEIPLQAYWTTFGNLNDKQKKWYFYWREQVLNGEYPDVDLSYIILFIYELMNYSFNQKASFNISMMVRLHEEYNGRIPKLSNYSTRWIADMLYEVKEQELAQEWADERNHIPPLYQQLQDKEDNLAKISITSWKPYIRNHRETEYFKVNKNKIYKVFKESLPLLQEVYEKENKKLLQYWFKINKERVIRHLFASAVVGRSHDGVHVYVERIKPTDDLSKEVTALFKLSENVTRQLNGEKREIKVNEEFLPEGFKEMMMEHFSNERNRRFKVVQKSEEIEQGGEIPPPPEKKPEVETKPKIEFNKSNIGKLQTDTDRLIETINSRSEAEEHEVKEQLKDKEKEEVRTNPPEQKTPLTTETDVLSALGGGAEFEGEVEFLEILTDIEKGFLNQFENGKYNQESANLFIKQKGLMLGMFISELNEKANEYIGDNLLESQGDDIVVYEEYEHVFLK